MSYLQNQLTNPHPWFKSNPFNELNSKGCHLVHYFFTSTDVMAKKS